MNPPVSATVPRRPRAAGLSRERIVSGALAYLQANPDQPLSIARAAATVGASPMAIYRHFADVTDLGHAIADRVLEGVEADIPVEAEWRDQARAWMVSIYRRLRETPQCAALIGSGETLAVAWMRAALVLHRILERSGLEGPRLSQSVFFVLLAVAGFARQTVVAPMPAQIEGTLAAIGRMPPEEAQALAGFAADVPAICQGALEIMVERILASVEMSVRD
jgi:AcrR family transcriptional regulator